MEIMCGGCQHPFHLQNRSKEQAKVSQSTPRVSKIHEGPKPLRAREPAVSPEGSPKGPEPRQDVRSPLKAPPGGRDMPRACKSSWRIMTASWWPRTPSSRCRPTGALPPGVGARQRRCRILWRHRAVAPPRPRYGSERPARTIERHYKI